MARAAIATPLPDGRALAEELHRTRRTKGYTGGNNPVYIALPSFRLYHTYARQMAHQSHIYYYYYYYRQDWLFIFVFVLVYNMTIVVRTLSPPTTPTVARRWLMFFFHGYYYRYCYIYLSKLLYYNVRTVRSDSTRAPPVIIMFIHILHEPKSFYIVLLLLFIYAKTGNCVKYI